MMENNQNEPYKMEKLKFWDKPYKPERREYNTTYMYEKESLKKFLL